jgi:hypothetical protein
MPVWLGTPDTKRDRSPRGTENGTPKSSDVAVTPRSGLDGLLVECCLGWLRGC